MKNCLTGRPIDIDSYIEAVRAVLLLNILFCQFQSLKQSPLFFGSRVEPVGNMPSEDQERVPGRNRVSFR